MKILALDSSAIVASVAVCEDETLLAECTLNNGNTHSETLLPTVEFLLNQLKLRPTDMDLFAVSSGPGSFTGVRIGVSTIKGLAFGTGIPCLGVSTLEALAENLRGFDGLICPVMNARRKQVYTALFRAEGGKIIRLTDDAAIPVSPDLADLIRQHKGTGEAIRFCGDGYGLIRDLLGDPEAETPERLRHQSGYGVAQVALHAFLDGKRGNDTDLVPIYLRASQAERERTERARTGYDPAKEQ